MPRRDDASACPRPEPWGTDPAPRPRAALAGSLFLVLVLALMTHGAVGPAARAACVLALGALATVALVLAPRLAGGEPLAIGPVGGAVSALLALAALGALSAHYTHAATARLAVLAGAGAVYLLTVLLATTRAWFRGLRFAALLLAGIGAVDAVAEHLRGIAVSGGPFVNPNHLATLLAAALPLALVAKALRCGEDRASVLSLFYLPLAALLVAGLLVTRSRGGLIAAGVGFLAAAVPVVVHIISARRERRGPRPGVPSIVAMALAVAALLLALGSAPGKQSLARFRPAPANSESSVGLRVSIWRSTLRAIGEGGPAGWGLGSFRFVYPAYRGVDIPYGVSHAHNDWLEGTLELGWAFPLVAVSACGILAWCAAATARGRRTHLAAGTAAGAGAGLVALATHAAIDFPLEIPFLIWFGALLAGLVSASARIPTPGRLFVAHGITVRRGPAAACAAVAAVLLGASGLRDARADAAIQRAERAIDALDTRGAQAEARHAVALDPGSAEAHTVLARALVLHAESGGGGRRSLDAAADALARATALNPRDADALLDLAQVRETLGEKTAADDAYGRAARLDPRSGLALEARAAFLLRAGRREEAVRTLRASAASDARALSRILSSLWKTTGDSALLRAVTPPSVRDRVLLGDFLDTQGRFDQARSAFADAESIGPKDPIPADHRAALLLRHGDAGGAFEVCRAALARGADSTDLRLLLAAALAASGKQDAAVRAYERLVADSAARPRAVEALADLYAGAGDRERLVDLRKRAARLAPGSARARAELAAAYRAAGHWSAAVETCRSLLAVEPSQAACRYLLADLYAERGLAEAAEFTLQTRLAQSPEDVTALTRLARLYAAAGRWPEARERYERVLAIEPGNAEARAVLSRREAAADNS